MSSLPFAPGSRPSTRPRRGAVWLALLLGPLGCKGPEEQAARCARGDAAACREACEKNVYGEGGCFQAAQAEYREARGDFEGPEWRRARTLFEKACTGGHADGCLFVAQLLEFPFSAKRQDKTGATTEWPAIDDGTIDARAKFLERACDLGAAKGCERLGEVSIGKKSDVAVRAYARACERGRSAAECLRAREKEVNAFEHYREACRRGVADACTALGNLVIRVDFPRALRVFMAEADVRGIAERAGGLQSFLDRRIEEARGAPVADPTAPAPPTAIPETVSVDFLSPTVDGRLAVSFVERGLAGARSKIARCVVGKPPDAELHFTAKLVVDRTGDVWSAVVESPDASPELATCVRDALLAVVMQPPVSGAADVEQGFVIRSAPTDEGAVKETPRPGP